MKTRDWRRAEWELSQMLMPEAQSDSSKGKPLDEAVANYLAGCEVRGLEPSTIRSYRKKLEAFATFCDRRGYFDSAQISVDLISSLRSSRPGKTEKGHVSDCPALLKRAGRRDCNCPVITNKASGKTLRKELENLRSFCTFCKDRDWMAKNPAAAVKQVKDESPGALPFEQSEINAILRACDSIDKNQRNQLRARALVLFKKSPMNKLLIIAIVVTRPRVGLRPSPHQWMKCAEQRVAQEG